MITETLKVNYHILQPCFFLQEISQDLGFENYHRSPFEVSTDVDCKGLHRTSNFNIVMGPLHYKVPLYIQLLFF